MYEVMKTRFVKRFDAVKNFEIYLENLKPIYVDDRAYREPALEEAIQRSGKRPLSLVDLVIRKILEDAQMNISAIVTFNTKDFADICVKRRIEILDHP